MATPGMMFDFSLRVAPPPNRAISTSQLVGGVPRPQLRLRFRQGADEEVRSIRITDERGIAGSPPLCSRHGAQVTDAWHVGCCSGRLGACVLHAQCPLFEENMNSGSSSVVTQPVPTHTEGALGVRANIVLKTLKGVSVSEVETSVAKGVITLNGVVRTTAQRAKAGLAVAGIDGVLGVRNLLEVEAASGVTSGLDGETEVPDSDTSSPPLSDGAIKERIESALRADQSKKLEGVKVTRVNHGVVQMSGKDVSMSGQWRAVELAWDAAGTEPEDAATKPA